ncbi:MAG: carboxypeptidase-like regulatory domain-containing protein [Candidatus Altiarchaeota archaeon]|nr:carboxypeptidase-like regulatory domain-containing protein [Candidatus Altiarchaeota archaeon]
MTVRGAILVLFAAALLAGFAAADVDPRDILPTTAEFQDAFGSDWKHPWEYPTNYPIYKTQVQMEDEFEQGLAIASSPEMAELLEGLDMEELGIDIDEFLGDATGGQSLSEMFSESAEVIENSAFEVDEYIITYGELEQSGGGYTLDRLEAKLQAQVMDEDYVRSHPEVIDTDMATTVEVPDISAPGFDMDVIEKGFGDTSSCARTISEGELYSETCAVKVCNLQFSIELIRATEDEVWDQDQIDALLEIVEARMGERVSEDLCTITLPEVTGKITDGAGHAIKHAQVTFNYKKRNYNSTTNDNGEYSFTMPSGIEPGQYGRVYVRLQYEKNETRYFQLINNNKTVWLMKKFYIYDESSLVQDIDMGENLSVSDSYYGHPDPEHISHFAAMYHHLTEALEFFRDHLGANVNYKLPVQVDTFVAGSGTYYSPTSARIVIGYDDSFKTDTDRPMNREWHEFAHHVQYSMYGRWPAGRSLAGTRNHNGYGNPSTADSFLEGFAEFSAMAIADHYNYSRPDDYASFGSLDIDYRAWTRRGYNEELAVAGILWDLYDVTNDEMVDLQLRDVWDIIRDYHKDFTSVYKAFLKEFPKEKKQIDEIFVRHGFFADMNPGNKKFDKAFEATYKKGGKYYYVDYGHDTVLDAPWMTHNENETIGPATSYGRPWRTNAGEIEGNYIKVDNPVPYYIVKVTFDDSSLDYEMRTENRNGLVYVHVPPAEYGATITVTAEGVGTGNPLTFTAEEFEENLADTLEKGYFVEHDFDISGTIPSLPAGPAAQGMDPNGKPHWEEPDSVADSDQRPPEDESLPLEDEMGPTTTIEVVKATTTVEVIPTDIEIAETQEPTTTLVKRTTTTLPTRGPGLLDQLMEFIGDIIGAIKSAVGGGPSDEIVCNPPYMRFGKECCLDRDGNSICDRDEATTSVALAVPATTVSAETTLAPATTTPTTSIVITTSAETTSPTTSIAITTPAETTVPTTTTLSIACILSSDCGEWGEEPVCHNGDVYIQVTTPICRNAGTPEAQCIEQVKFAGASIYSEPRMEEECNDGCQDGECL